MKASLTLNTLLILLFICSGSQASQDNVTNIVNVLEIGSAHHLGDDNNSLWEDEITEGLSFYREFYIEPQWSDVWVELLVWGPRYRDNPVYFNNISLAKICLNPEASWVPCNISIPNRYLHNGKNSIEVRSRWHLWTVDFDDFQMKDIRVRVRYESINSKLIPHRSIDVNEAFIDEPINVTVTLINIGSKPAYNVSIREMKPEGTFLTKGNLTLFMSPIGGGNILRMRYTIVPHEVGELRAWPAKISYFNNLGEYKEIEPEIFKLLVKPTTPSILFRKFKYGDESIGGKQSVLLFVENNGTETAYNLSVYDTLPEPYKVVDGRTNHTIEYLNPGSNFSISYNITPKIEVDYLSSGWVDFQDSIGTPYKMRSNQIELMPKYVVLNNPNTQFLVLIGVIVIILLMGFIIILVKRR